MASFCVIKKPQECGGHGPHWAAAPQKRNKPLLIILSNWVDCNLQYTINKKSLYFPHSQIPLSDPLTYRNPADTLSSIIHKADSRFKCMGWKWINISNIFCVLCDLYVAENLILGAFAKLRKAIINFVTSVCPSVCPNGITRLKMDGYLWFWCSCDGASLIWNDVWDQLDAKKIMVY